MFYLGVVPKVPAAPSAMISGAIAGCLAIGVGAGTAGVQNALIVEACVNKKRAGGARMRGARGVCTHSPERNRAVAHGVDFSGASPRRRTHRTTGAL